MSSQENHINVTKKKVTAREPEFRSQEPGVGMRTPAAIFEDLGYGDVSELMQLLKEVSKLRKAYSHAILPDSLRGRGDS